MDITMNTLIFLDLYWTIADPFKPTRFRFRYYLVAVTCIGFIQTMVMNQLWTFQSVFQLNIGSICLTSILGTLLLASLVSSFLLWNRLSKKGTSQELKSIVMKRNYIYFAIFLCTSVCAMITQSGANYNPRGILYPKRDAAIENWWVIASYSLGVPLAIVRLTEPFVW